MRSYEEVQQARVDSETKAIEIAKAEKLHKVQAMHE